MSCGVALRGAGWGSPVMSMLFATAKLERSLGLRAVDRHVALIEEQLHARTANAVELRGDEMIEALAGGLRWDGDRTRFNHGKVFRFPAVRKATAQWG